MSCKQYLPVAIQIKMAFARNSSLCLTITMRHMEFFDTDLFENYYFRVKSPAPNAHFIDFYLGN